VYGDACMGMPGETSCALMPDLPCMRIMHGARIFGLDQGN
jgi:hypothetical protein